MRDAFEKFQSAGIELFAISYDDQQVLSEFSQKQKIPYRLLSDIDSKIIRRYGILNDQVGPEDALLEGLPYPGVYVTDENGIVIAKFFHDSYKKRDSPEMLIDAALGHVLLSENEPRVTTEDPEVRISASIHGGKGTIRQGIRRQIILRCELQGEMHMYGEPVPDGMIPTTVSISAAPGLVVEEPVYPPSNKMWIESMGLHLFVWSGTFDIVIPFYAVGELASETRPLDTPNSKIEITIKYQACDQTICLPPTKKTLSLEVDLDVIDVPALGLHTGHGQRESNFSGQAHLRRLLLRKFKKYPLGLPLFAIKTLKLELAAKWRNFRKSE